MKLKKTETTTFEVTGNSQNAAFNKLQQQIWEKYGDIYDAEDKDVIVNIVEQEVNHVDEPYTENGKTYSKHVTVKATVEAEIIVDFEDDFEIMHEE